MEIQLELFTNYDANKNKMVIYHRLKKPCIKNKKKEHISPVYIVQNNTHQT
jgi:hypothetical protein